jgi:hypothetical protein
MLEVVSLESFSVRCGMSITLCLMFEMHEWLTIRGIFGKLSPFILDN